MLEPKTKSELKRSIHDADGLLDDSDKLGILYRKFSLVSVTLKWRQQKEINAIADFADFAECDAVEFSVVDNVR